jgi:hypothetical protein
MGQIHFNRVEDMWCATYITPGINTDPVLIASIHIAAVDNEPEIKQSFIKLVQQIVMNIFRATDERFSPEHVEWATEQMPSDEKLN